MGPTQFSGALAMIQGQQFSRIQILGLIELRTELIPRAKCGRDTGELSGLTTGTTNGD